MYSGDNCFLRHPENSHRKHKYFLSREVCIIAYTCIQRSILIHVYEEVYKDILNLLLGQKPPDKKRPTISPRYKNPPKKTRG